jgi:hypothetical protein
VVKVLRRWVPGCEEQQVVERDVSPLVTSRPGPGGGWAGSAELQGWWVGVVRRQAARIGACAGMCAGQSGGPVHLEEVTYPDWSPEMVIPPPEYDQVDPPVRRDSGRHR